MRRRLPSALGLLLLPGLVGGQPSEVSDAQRLRATQMELNACDLSARQARKLLAEELRAALERAEKAEHALAAVPKDPKPGAEKPAP